METFTLELKTLDKTASIDIIEATNNEGIIIHSMMTNNVDETTAVGTIILSVATSLQKVELLKQKLERLNQIKEVTIKAQ
jgi:hypothetical protein